MTAAIFGLALAPLYAAIAEVESSRGATSDNVYQLRVIYVADCNRIKANKKPADKAVRRYTVEDAVDKRKSEEMMALCWSHYGKKYCADTGKSVTYEVLARMHNGGPDGWKKRKTSGCWRKVKKVMENQTEEDVKAWTSRNTAKKGR